MQATPRISEQLQTDSQERCWDLSPTKKLNFANNRNELVSRFFFPRGSTKGLSSANMLTLACEPGQRIQSGHAQNSNLQKYEPINGCF